MIVKFDHIAYACSRNELKAVLEKLKGYSKVFLDQNLPNLDIKHSFMNHWCDTHDIYLLTCNHSLPIEITAYKQVSEGNKYELVDDTILVNTTSIEESMNFYKAIGFKSYNESEMLIKPIIGDREIKLGFNKLANTINYLDSAGYCCLAFVTNNAEKEKNKLEKENVCTTEVRPLCVNSKQMNIFFAYNDFGDICEFISIEEA